jgi:2-haloacid dehalogenase
MPIKLVTFDVYMALLDIQGSLMPVVADAFSMDTCTSAAFTQLWRTKQMERASVSNSLGMGHTPFRDCTRIGLDYALAKHDLNMTEDAREKLIAAWDRMTPWPEAPDLVHAVKAKGYTTAILSNGDQDMLDAIAQVFEGGFDHVLSCETAGHYKPHPDVYDLPTRVLGMAKDDVLHVAGASGDVLGAKASGMTCYWSNRTRDRVLDPAFEPDYQGSDLTGVLNIL